jgi:hypothetical protein
MCLRTIALVFELKLKAGPYHSAGDYHFVQRTENLDGLGRAQPLQQPSLDLGVVP